MGIGSSFHRPVPERGNAECGPQVTMPPLPPYNGHEIVYHHEIIKTNMEEKTRTIPFAQPDVTVTCTNVDQYFPKLAALYQEGFKMLAFASMPVSKHSRSGFTSVSIQTEMKFQGIFRRLFPEEMSQQWELRRTKSELVNQMFGNFTGKLMLSWQSNISSDTSHIFKTINHISQQGGRLISVTVSGMDLQQIQMTGRTRHDEQQYSNRRGDMWSDYKKRMQCAVDVFYEVPRNPTDERYAYQIVSCPMHSTFRGGSYTYQSVIACEEVITQYIETGWKLVEIFEDFSHSTSMKGGFSAQHTQTKNCLWIFEKPVSRMNDNTPLYEGTMVEHCYTTTNSLQGFNRMIENVETNWEPVLEHFGKSGWQVVRILTTPDTQHENRLFTSTTKTRTRQMIFLQRLREGHSEFPGVPSENGEPSQSMPDALPPSYSQI